MYGMTKKVAAHWQKKVTDAVLSLGAAPDEDDSATYRSFVLDTIHGRLRVFPRESAIRTRFDQIPASAPAGASLNRFSGKWNFEFGMPPTELELAHAVESIAAILVPRAASAGPSARAVSDFQQVASALLSKHYGLGLNDTLLWDAVLIQQYLESGVRPYEAVSEHAEETDLERIDLPAVYGEYQKCALSADDEQRAIEEIARGV